MTAPEPIRLNEFQSGTLFQQYQLLEQIGTGGQGVVWSALDGAPARIVAIKFNETPAPNLENKDDLAFKHQAEKLVELRHPFILPLHNFGQSGQIQYLVSSYIPGGSLLDRLKSAPFDPAEALHFAAEIAAALDYLHAQRVVHRDLKPGNVLLDLSQNAYVADFGLARLVSATTEVMHTGRGTPPYAPPEQHTMARMTPQSDIFSFGIMLYELFTRQLPWNGEKALGMQQLYSQDEIPDPREIDPALPPMLVKVLRAMTAADPAARPPSAGEAMRVIFALFNNPPAPALPEASPDEPALRKIDAQEILKRNLTGWTLTEGTAISLTKFALIDLTLRPTDLAGLPVDVQHFMLLHALTYGYHDELWWKRVTSPDERLKVATALLRRGIEAIAARVVSHLVLDPEAHNLESPITKELTARLLEMAIKTGDPFLQQQSLKALQNLFPPAKSWSDTILSPEQDQALASLALGGTPQGELAAQLIGHFRARRALQNVLKMSDDERRAPALLAIQRTAGGLPTSTPVQVRMEVSADLTLRRLFARPWHILAAYSLAFLGATLGFGACFYLNQLYRYPGGFLDILIIQDSLGRGIFLGAALGLGLLLSRLMAERFWARNAFLGTALSALLGGVLLNAALFIYQVWLLGTPPNGLVITAGCLLVGLGFSLGGRIRTRLGKIGISAVALLAALAGSWWIHTAYANLPTDLTPMIPFDYTMPSTWVLGLMLLIALPTAIGANLVNLAYEE